MHTRSRRWLTRAAPLLAAMVVVLCGVAVGAWADAGVGSWSATGAMLMTWDGGSMATLLADDRVLVVGGGELSATELYDPNLGVWTRGPELRAPEGQRTLVALAEGGALLLGGAVCGNLTCTPTTHAYRLNSTASEWSLAAPPETARVDPIAVRLNDGRVLVAGGFGSECPDTPWGYACNQLASAEIYDPFSNEWSATVAMPQPRGGASATLLSDGTVLIVGGDEMTAAIRYDPTAGDWTVAGQAIQIRTGSLLAALPGDRALALGSQPAADYFGSARGVGEQAPLICNPLSSEVFTAVSDTWTGAASEPSDVENCRYSHGALLTGGQFLLDDQGIPTGAGPFALDAEQRCWSTTRPPLEPRNEGAVVALSDGRALVFGGRGTGEQWLSSAEIYTPGSPGCTPVVTPPTPVDPITTPFRPPRFTGATIARHKHLTLTATDSVRLHAQCSAGAAGHCLGQVELLLLAPPSSGVGSRSHAMRLLLGEAYFSAVAGGAATVTVHVTDHRRALYAAIRRQRRAAIALVVTALDDTGQVFTTTVSGALREPGRASFRPAQGTGRRLNARP